MSIERVVFRVLRPVFAKESDPGPGFPLLREHKASFVKKPKLDRALDRRLAQLTEEQFEMRQLFLGKKRAKRELRVRAQGLERERERILFRQRVIA